MVRYLVAYWRKSAAVQKILPSCLLHVWVARRRLSKCYRVVNVVMFYVYVKWHHPVMVESVRVYVCTVWLFLLFYMRCLNKCLSAADLCWSHLISPHQKVKMPVRKLFEELFYCSTVAVNTFGHYFINPHYRNGEQLQSQLVSSLV